MYRVIAAFSTAEVVCIFTLSKVVSSQAIKLILADVTVYNVQQDNYAKTMRFIDQRLELIRSPASRSWGKRICYMIPKTAIVRMLLANIAL